MINAEKLDTLRSGQPVEVTSQLRGGSPMTVVRVADWPAGSDPALPPHFSTLVTDTGLHLTLAEVDG